MFECEFVDREECVRGENGGVIEGKSDEGERERERERKREREREKEREREISPTFLTYL